MICCKAIWLCWVIGCTMRCIRMHCWSGSCTMFEIINISTWNAWLSFQSKNLIQNSIETTPGRTVHHILNKLSLNSWFGETILCNHMCFEVKSNSFSRLTKLEIWQSCNSFLDSCNVTSWELFCIHISGSGVCIEKICNDVRIECFWLCNRSNCWN